MKPLPSIALAGLLVLPLTGSTEDIPWSREYGWVEFGGAVIPDLDARLGVTGGTSTVHSDLELELSPGFSVNGGLGERLSDWLAVEIQGGFLYHNVDEVNAADGSFRSLDASLMQVPVFFNFVFELPLRSRFTPYAGVGAGAMINWLDIDDQIAAGDSVVVSVDGSSTEVNFAYQAFAGGRLRMGDQGVLEITYRFMGCSSPNWSLKAEDTGDSIANLKADDIFVHALTVGFIVEF
ncbi:MAG: outer membrane beta-barrel protein [Verrucomicrobia bacterium]|nr:outer membrane beta-barrel protein [Verrucomicrobiota bacterium]